MAQEVQLFWVWKQLAQGEVQLEHVSNVVLAYVPDGQLDAITQA